MITKKKKYIPLKKKIRSPTNTIINFFEMTSTLNTPNIFKFGGEICCFLLQVGANNYSNPSTKNKVLYFIN